MSRWLMAVVITSLVFALPLLPTLAQPTSQQEVRILKPQDEAAVEGEVEILAEGIGFIDLHLFGYAHFWYSSGGERFTFLGMDANGSDGFSLVWDTNQVPDGRYLIKVTIADLLNNQGANQIAVTVSNHGIESITEEIVDTVGKAFKGAGDALEFDKQKGLTEVINDVVNGFGVAAMSFNSAAQDLKEIGSTVRNSIAAADPIISKAGLYEALGKAFASAGANLRAINIDGAVEGLKNIQEIMLALASTRFDDVNFDLLYLATQEIDEAVEAVLGLKEFISGAKQGDPSEVAERALLALEEIGCSFREIGIELSELAEQKLVTFADVNGNPVTKHELGEVLVINASRARRIKVEIFRQSGDLVFTGAAEGDRFEWDGKGDAGELVTRGIYFYRITFESDGIERVRMGKLVIV